MTWTDIGPTETAAAMLVDLMTTLHLQCATYEATGAPVTAENRTLVIDELFSAWEYLCMKKPLPQSATAENRFGRWLTSPDEQARVSGLFYPAIYSPDPI
jgi:hypothetical protein